MEKLNEKYQKVNDNFENEKESIMKSQYRQKLLNLTLEINKLNE